MIKLIPANTPVIASSPGRRNLEKKGSEKPTSEYYDGIMVALHEKTCCRDMLLQYVLVTYSCFDKGCTTTAQKGTRQCRLVLWVAIVWHFTVFSSRERESINTRVCTASFSNTEIPWASINQVKNHCFNTHNNF